MDPASDVSVGFRLDALHQNEVNLYIHIFKRALDFENMLALRLLERIL